MNNKKLFILSISLYLGFLSIAKAQENGDILNLNQMVQPLKQTGIFKDPNYYNWGGSIYKDKDCTYHLFYSRWKKEYSFAGWLAFSEIAHAVSKSPEGPWTYKETVLKGRGEGNWDAITAHNPKIKYFDGKYYLYYIATNFGEQQYSDKLLRESVGKPLSDPNKKLLRENQRTGVAVSNSLNGPWERKSTPLIEPEGPIATLTVNPAIDKGKDGKYYLIVKGDKPNETKFIRNQAIAVSNSPEGPFVMQNNPVIGNLDTEDVSMWYKDRFYAVFHAHTYIGLMTSLDGLNWNKANHYLITKKKIELDDGTFLVPDRMERPFVYLENGVPSVLCLAIKKGNESYPIFIPLKK